jgi:hypothetical protein
LGVTCFGGLKKKKSALTFCSFHPIPLPMGKKGHTKSTGFILLCLAKFIKYKSIASKRGRRAGVFGRLAQLDLGLIQFWYFSLYIRSPTTRFHWEIKKTGEQNTNPISVVLFN